MYKVIIWYTSIWPGVTLRKWDQSGLWVISQETISRNSLHHVFFRPRATTKTILKGLWLAIGNDLGYLVKSIIYLYQTESSSKL